MPLFYYRGSLRKFLLEDLHAFLVTHNHVASADDTSYLTISQLEQLCTDRVIFGVAQTDTNAGKKIEALSIALLYDGKYAHVSFLCVAREMRGSGLAKTFVESFETVSREHFGVEGYSCFRVYNEKLETWPNYIATVQQWLVIRKADDVVDENFSLIVIPGYEAFTTYILKDQQGKPEALFFFVVYTSRRYGTIHALARAVGDMKKMRGIGLEFITGNNIFDYEAHSLGEIYTSPMMLMSTIPRTEMRFFF